MQSLVYEASSLCSECDRESIRLAEESFTDTGFVLDFPVDACVSCKSAGRVGCRVRLYPNDDLVRGLTSQLCMVADGTPKEQTNARRSILSILRTTFRDDGCKYYAWMRVLPHGVAVCSKRRSFEHRDYLSRVTDAACTPTPRTLLVWCGLALVLVLGMCVACRTSDLSDIERILAQQPRWIHTGAAILVGVLLVACMYFRSTPGVRRAYMGPTSHRRIIQPQPPADVPGGPLPDGGGVVGGGDTDGVESFGKVDIGIYGGSGVAEPAPEVDTTPLVSGEGVEVSHVVHGGHGLELTNTSYGDSPEERDDRTAARCIGPILGPAVTHGHTEKSLDEAKDKRIDKKRREPKLLHADRTQITCVVDAIKRCVFTREFMDRFCEENPTIEHLASKKWSFARLELAGGQAHIPGVRPDFEASIKTNETLDAAEKVKPPRIIIADGDVGQYIHLLPCALLEAGLFEYFKHHNIKHLAKMDAMAKVQSRMNFTAKDDRHIVFAGDGSAWDTTINEEIQSLIDIPILQHICDYLVNSKHPGFSQEWGTYVLKPRAAKKLSVRFRVRHEVIRRILPQMRRSGDRGTSVLNWLVNFTMWHAIMLDNPAEVVERPGRTKFKLRNKVSGNLVSCFEGDDSLLCTDVPIDASFRAHIDRMWSRAGFDMKLEITESGVLTFVGYDLLVNKGIKGYCPELRRALVSSAWTCARVDEGDIPRLAYEKFLSRALEFSSANPYAAAYFYACAKHYDKFEGAFTTDASFAVGERDIGEARTVVEAAISDAYTAESVPVGIEIAAMKYNKHGCITHEQCLALLNASGGSLGPEDSTMAVGLLPGGWLSC